MPSKNDARYGTGKKAHRHSELDALAGTWSEEDARDFAEALAELRVGFRGGVRQARNLDELERFFLSPRVEVSPMTEQTAILYAEIFGTLKRKGTPIPINDIWIAAVTLDQGSIPFSRDEH
jgi:predicted nucleic acid-binding protein